MHFSVIGTAVTTLLVGLIQLSSADQPTGAVARSVVWQLNDELEGLISGDAAVKSGKELDNGIFDCSNPSDILRIDYVKLVPNPPRRSKPLNIQASGYFSKQVTAGAYAKVIVKIGIFKILERDFDICEEIEKGDIQCPLGPGPMSINKMIDIPREVPPGKIHANAMAFTADGEPIGCVNADLQFIGF